MTGTRLHIVHETVYDYAAPVSLSQQLLHLRPRTFQFQQCERHATRVDPEPVECVDSQDYFGNASQYVAITAPHTRLVVSADSTVRLLPRPGRELLADSLPWEQVRDGLRGLGDPKWLDPLKYLYSSPHVTVSDELGAYARGSFRPGASVLAAAFDLMQRIHADFRFDPEATSISTPLSELLILRRGVCQDFAHLMIGCLRTLGIPCRYVSGYILTVPAPGQPRLAGADASHAWVSVYCPSIGWVDFDPTNSCLVNLEHVSLGWGRDFSDVTPLRGVVLGGGAHTPAVSVTVTPL
jgi:transglutaminase-like putative cysteine protease